MNITGNPSEHNNSIMFTDAANKTIPRSASPNDFSLTIFWIELIIFFLFLVSTTSHPSSNLLRKNLIIEYTPNITATIAIAALI